MQRPLQCSTTTFLTSVRTSISYRFRQMGVQAVTVLVYCDIYIYIYTVTYIFTATIRSCDSLSGCSSCNWEFKGIQRIHRCICRLSRWSLQGVNIIKHAGCHAALLPACIFSWVLLKRTMVADMRASRVYPSLHRCT